MDLNVYGLPTAEVAIGLSERMTPLRILPDGTLDAIIPLPVSNVSSIELGGPDMRDAWITTAWELLSEEEHEAQPLAGSLFRTRVEVPGVPRIPYAG